MSGEFDPSADIIRSQLRAAVGQYEELGAFAEQLREDNQTLPGKLNQLAIRAGELGGDAMAAVERDSGWAIAALRQHCDTGPDSFIAAIHGADAWSQDIANCVRRLADDNLSGAVLLLQAASPNNGDWPEYKQAWTLISDVATMLDQEEADGDAAAPDQKDVSYEDDTNSIATRLARYYSDMLLDCQEIKDTAARLLDEYYRGHIPSDAMRHRHAEELKRLYTGLYRNLLSTGITEQCRADYFHGLSRHIGFIASSIRFIEQTT